MLANRYEHYLSRLPVDVLAGAGPRHSNEQGKPVTWIAEHKVTWILPSGERRPGRIAIGVPEAIAATEEAAEHAWCAYVLDGLPSAMGQARRAGGADTLQALWHAMQMIGLHLYLSFADGVRVLYPEEDEQTEDPLGDTAHLLGLLGPLIRAHGNDRGPADPEGKLAALEAKHAEMQAEMKREIEEGEEE